MVSIDFIFFNLPPELQKKILDSIDTEKGILNARKTCCDWWHYFKEVPVFCEGYIIGRSIFTRDTFIFQDKEQKTIRKMVFRPYGQWKYHEYAPSVFIVRIKESSKIYQTQMSDYSNIHYNRILTSDSRYGVISEKKIPKLVHPGNCCIS